MSWGLMYIFESLQKPKKQHLNEEKKKRIHPLITIQLCDKISPKPRGKYLLFLETHGNILFMV